LFIGLAQAPNIALYHAFCLHIVCTNRVTTIHNSW